MHGPGVREDTRHGLVGDGGTACGREEGDDLGRDGGEGSVLADEVQDGGVEVRPVDDRKALRDSIVRVA